MKGKKAFELSATFLVILILTIVIFVGSIYFMRQFFSSAESMRATIDAETENEIRAVLYRQGSTVAIPISKETVERGKHSAFGVGIKNIFDSEKSFFLMVAFKSAFDSEEQRIDGADATFINEKWLLYNTNPIKIEKDELAVVPVLIKGDMNMGDSVSTERPGVYSFNVCILSDAIPQGFDCAEPDLNNPNLYTGKAYKLYLEIK